MKSFKKFYENNSSSINKVFSIILLFFAIFIFLKIFAPLFMPFIIGYIISIILEPVTRFFENRFRISRSIASLLSIFALITLIGLIGSGIVYAIQSQLSDLIMNIDVYSANLNFVIIKINDFFDSLFFLVPDNLSESANNFLLEIIPKIVSSAGSYVKDLAVAIAKTIPLITVYLFIGIFSSFFFIRDKEYIKNVFIKNIPIFFLDRFFIAKKGLGNAIGGYFKAQLILMSITGSIAIIGLVILGYPYGFLIGICIAIIDALPFFGSGFILWPWSVYYFASGDLTRGLMLLVLYGVILITRQMLEPKILGKQIGLHPLITLMSIFVGVNLIGVFGIILGPILVVIIKAILLSDISKKS